MEAVTVEGTEADKTWSPECQHWRDKCGPMNVRTSVEREPASVTLYIYRLTHSHAHPYVQHRTLQEAIAAGDKTWNGDCWHWKNKCGWTHVRTHG